MSKSAQHQLTIVLAIVLLGFMGNSIAYPILAPLFLHPAHGDIVPYAWGQHARAIFFGITLMMYPIGQFIGSPILGALSDRHGRKKILLISAWAQTAFYLVTAFSLTFNALWLLIASRFLTGVAEGNISIARSIVVDNKELNRHKSLGLISAMTAIGYIIGPFIGGVLADHTLVSWFSFPIPFYAAALLSFIIVVVATLYLHESLAKRYDSGITLWQQFNIFHRMTVLCKNKLLKILLIASTVASLSYDIFYEFYPAYLTGLWHTTPLQIAWYTILLSAAIAVGCGWLSYNLARFISVRRLILTSLATIAIILVALLFVPPIWLLLILFVIIGFALGMASTNYTLKVSEAADSEIQGEVFGTLWGIRMLLDGTISVVGGFLLIVSYRLPIGIAAVAATAAWIVFYTFVKKVSR